MYQCRIRITFLFLSWDSSRCLNKSRPREKGWAHTLCTNNRKHIAENEAMVLVVSCLFTVSIFSLAFQHFHSHLPFSSSFTHSHQRYNSSNNNKDHQKHGFSSFCFVLDPVLDKITLDNHVLRNNQASHLGGGNLAAVSRITIEFCNFFLLIKRFSQRIALPKESFMKACSLVESNSTDS